MSESPHRTTTDAEVADQSLYEKLHANREKLETIAKEDVPFAKDARQLLALLEDLEGED